MKTEDVLKMKERDVRVTSYDKWLVWSDNNNAYTVYQRKMYAKKTRTLFVSIDYSKALEVLVLSD